MKLTRTSTGTPWEREIGYARAVRGGGLVAVSATVAADPEGRPLAGDAYGQARVILRIIDRALVRLGSRLDHVLRLRIYYADPAVGEGAGRALREAFGEAVPAVTGVRVAGLVDPAFLLEIEADAAAADWAPDPRLPRPPEGDEGGD